MDEGMGICDMSVELVVTGEVCPEGPATEGGGLVVCWIVATVGVLSG